MRVAADAWRLARKKMNDKDFKVVLLSSNSAKKLYNFLYSRTLFV